MDAIDHAIVVRGLNPTDVSRLCGISRQWVYKIRKREVDNLTRAVIRKILKGLR